MGRVLADTSQFCDMTENIAQTFQIQHQNEILDAEYFCVK